MRRSQVGNESSFQEEGERKKNKQINRDKYTPLPKVFERLGKILGPNFYKRHFSEKVRSNFGGKTK